MDWKLMNKTFAGAFLVTAALLLPQVSVAGVYMCVDPDTGKKTFTDRACPTAGKGTRVRVEPTNFGDSAAKRTSRGTWTSDKDRSVSGRSNLADKPRVATTISGNGLLGAGS